ncbi:hypothetical protein M434DRAFT_37593 [Hypoxylon sp. CO27-5]|nr:hypothetical protein M434DRAFT_37593 [Hypoxylon sp. CO27-5]
MLTSTLPIPPGVQPVLPTVVATKKLAGFVFRFILAGAFTAVVYRIIFTPNIEALADEEQTLF